jgi:hypothetical protein
MCNGADPVWSDHNLEQHYNKRCEDSVCIQDPIWLRDCTLQQMGLEQYRSRSCYAVEHAWAVYEGEGRDVEGRVYYHRAAYFIDDDLMVAITDTYRETFITCYHEHLNYSHEHSLGWTAGRRQIEFRKHLLKQEQFRMIRKVRRIRGFPQCMRCSNS